MMRKTQTKNLHIRFSAMTKPPSSPTTTTTATTATAFSKTYNSIDEDFSAPASPSSAALSTDTDMSEAEAEGPTTPDLTAVYASCRFFISSPGRSNSIVDDSLLPEEEEEEETTENNNSPAPPAVVDGGIPVPTYSPDPYVDFRRSMQEMVEARDLEGVTLWDYLIKELLLSYLLLNPKSSHKYIVGAFADLVISLLSPPNLHYASSSNSSTNGDDDHNGGHVKLSS